MHWHRIFIPIAIALGGCAGAPVSLTSAGRVVVPASQLPGTLGQSGWSPTEAQVVSCETAIAHALAKERRDLGTYYLRLGGVNRNGSRYIVGFAVDQRADDARYLRPPSEEVILLPAFGGGEVYFSFDYDVDQEKLVKLEFNAPL